VCVSNCQLGAIFGSRRHFGTREHELAANKVDIKVLRVSHLKTNKSLLLLVMRRRKMGFRRGNEDEWHLHVCRAARDLESGKKKRKAESEQDFAERRRRRGERIFELRSDETRRSLNPLGGR